MTGEELRTVWDAMEVDSEKCEGCCHLSVRREPGEAWGETFMERVIECELARLDIDECPRLQDIGG